MKRHTSSLPLGARATIPKRTTDDNRPSLSIDEHVLHVLCSVQGLRRWEAHRWFGTRVGVVHTNACDGRPNPLLHDVQLLLTPPLSHCPHQRPLTKKRCTRLPECRLVWNTCVLSFVSSLSVSFNALPAPVAQLLQTYHRRLVQQCENREVGRVSLDELCAALLWKEMLRKQHLLPQLSTHDVQQIMQLRSVATDCEAIAYILPEPETRSTTAASSFCAAATVPLSPCFGAHALFWLLRNRYARQHVGSSSRTEEALFRVTCYAHGFVRLAGVVQQLALMANLVDDRTTTSTSEVLHEVHDNLHDDIARVLGHLFRTTQSALQRRMVTEMHRETLLPLLCTYRAHYDYSGLRYHNNGYRYTPARTGVLVRRYTHTSSVYLAHEHDTDTGKTDQRPNRPFDVVQELHNPRNRFLNLVDVLTPSDLRLFHRQCSELLLGSFNGTPTTTSVHVRLVFDVVPTHSSVDNVTGVCQNVLGADSSLTAVSTSFDFDGCVYVPFLLDDLPLKPVATATTSYLALIAQRLKRVPHLHLTVAHVHRRQCLSAEAVHLRLTHPAWQALGVDGTLLRERRWCVVFDDNRAWQMRGDGFAVLPLGGNLARAQLPWVAAGAPLTVHRNTSASSSPIHLGITHDIAPRLQADVRSEVHREKTSADSHVTRHVRKALQTCAHVAYGLPHEAPPHEWAHEWEHEWAHEWEHEWTPPPFASAATVSASPAVRVAWEDTPLRGLQCVEHVPAGTVLHYRTTAMQSQARTPTYTIDDLPIFTCGYGVYQTRVAYEPVHDNGGHDSAHLLQYCNEAQTPLFQTVHLHTMPRYTSVDVVEHVRAFLQRHLHSSEHVHTLVETLSNVERAFLSVHVDAIFTHPQSVLQASPCIVCSTTDSLHACGRTCNWALRTRTDAQTETLHYAHDYAKWAHDRTILSADLLAHDLDVLPRRARLALHWLLAHLDPYGCIHEPHHREALDTLVRTLVVERPLPSTVQGVVLRDVTPMTRRARAFVYGEAHCDEPDVERAHSELLTLYDGDRALGGRLGQ